MSEGKEVGGLVWSLIIKVGVLWDRVEKKSPDANPDDLGVRDRRNKDIAKDEVR